MNKCRAAPLHGHVFRSVSVLLKQTRRSLSGRDDLAALPSVTSSRRVRRQCPVKKMRSGLGNEISGCALHTGFDYFSRGAGRADGP